MHNEAFEVLHYDSNNIYLGTTRPNNDGEPEDHTIDIEFKTFMETFCLNYCSITHKAQGETITEDFFLFTIGIKRAPNADTQHYQEQNKQNKFHWVILIYPLKLKHLNQIVKRKFQNIQNIIWRKT
jgi:hypothetical protein